MNQQQQQTEHLNKSVKQDNCSRGFSVNNKSQVREIWAGLLT